MPCLYDVITIISLNYAHVMHWHLECSIYLCNNIVCSLFVNCCYCKIIHLAQKEHHFPIESHTVDAWLMVGGFESNLGEDSVNVLLQ